MVLAPYKLTSFGPHVIVPSRLKSKECINQFRSGSTTSLAMISLMDSMTHFQSALLFPGISLLPRSISKPTTRRIIETPRTSSLKPIHLPSQRIFSSTRSSPSPFPNLKSRLQNGETLYGIFLLTFSPTMAEIAGLAGYDYAVVDMEHGHGSISDALPCLHALTSTGTPAILRLPENSPLWAKKALDLGPQGIMFPVIDDPQSARRAVSYSRFPPDGVRGSAHTVIRASDYGIDTGYLNNYQEDLMIICQVETLQGAKKIGDIATVDGVDCVQMGPLDLSASAGYLWDPAHKRVKEIMREAERVVLETNCAAYLGGFAMPHDSPQDLRSRGYHMVAGAVDVALFRTATVEDVKKFKASVENPGDQVLQDEEQVGDEKYWSE